MASSGSYDFNVSRTEIIESALRKCGELIQGASANSDQLTDGAEALNVVLKAFQASGMPLWNITKGYVFPQEDVSSVDLGPSGDHASTELIHTQLSAAAAASATTITVDSITSIANADNIGIECSDGTIHWDTVNGAPSGSTVTLTTGLDAAAAVDANVYAYTSKIVRPLRIIEAYRREYKAGDGQLGGTTTPINIVSREEHFRISDHTVEGVPYEIYYDPQLTDGVLHFVNRFQDGKSLIEFYFHRPFEDMDGASDNLGFPQEWFSAIIWELAAVLAVENGAPYNKFRTIQAKAVAEKQLVEEMGMEEGSVRFVPDYTRRMR